MAGILGNQQSLLGIPKQSCPPLDHSSLKNSRWHFLYSIRFNEQGTGERPGILLSLNTLRQEVGSNLNKTIHIKELLSF